MQLKISHYQEQPFLWCPHQIRVRASDGRSFNFLLALIVWEATDVVHRSKALVAKVKQAAVYRTPMELEKGGVIKLNRKRGNPRARRKRAKMRSKQ